MKPNSTPRVKDTMPIKAVQDELVLLRRTFREVIGHYSADLESKIAELISLVGVQAEAENEKAPRERVHEIRDMLMLLRGLDVKPEKGRRRDLKRIENLIEDLKLIAERW